MARWTRIRASIEYGVLSIGRCIASGGRWRPQVAGGGQHYPNPGRADRLGQPRLSEGAQPYPRQRIHLRVSGDGHVRRGFRCRPFGHRELAPGFRRLKAERLIPERLTTVAVTRHLE